MYFLYLKFSGLIATFDVRKEPGQRLVQAKLGRPENKDQLEEIVDDQNYEVIQNS